jgi:hypothetical protein
MNKTEKTILEGISAKLDRLLNFFPAEDNTLPTALKVDYSKFTPYGGVRIVEVDAIIDSWLRSDDPLRVKVAKLTPRNYCFIDYDSTFDEDTTNQIEANQARLGMMSGFGDKHVSPLVSMLPMYKHKNGKVSWSQVGGFQLMMGGWTKIQKRQVAIIPKHSVVFNGNFTRPDTNKEEIWLKEFKGMIPQWVEQSMQDEYNRLKPLGT